MGGKARITSEDVLEKIKIIIAVIIGFIIIIIIIIIIIKDLLSTV